MKPISQVTQKIYEALRDSHYCPACHTQEIKECKHSFICKHCGYTIWKSEIPSIILLMIAESERKKIEEFPEFEAITGFITGTKRKKERKGD